MRYYSYAPRRPEVSASVEVLWHYSGRMVTCPGERILSDGRGELLINLGPASLQVRDGSSSAVSSRVPDLTLVGSRTSPYELPVEAPFELMGVVFRPSALSQVSGSRASDLYGAWVSAKDLWGSGVSVLSEQLRSAATLRERFALLEAQLAEWLRRHALGSPHRAVDHAIGALTEGSAPSITSVSADVGLSGRRLSQVFRERVGMPPKRFARLQRFQRLLGALEMRTEPDWSQLALEFGYCDQAHMSHEFKELSGYSPVAFRLARERHRGHVPLGVHPFLTVCAR